MNTSELARRDKFQFSMLLNDKRYRSYTFQFFALFILICAMAYLGKNLLENLAAAGLNISYSFLGEPAGYDINQRLIEYNSQSTHLRASIVGVLNTLLVAFLGCIAATFFGVTAGILRLSNNWIVAKLMMIYVEIFRNVPVLIWILIIHSVFLAFLPQPKAFRGENPEATMLWDAFAFTGRGFYIPKPVFNDGSFIVIVTFFLSIIGIFAFRYYARQKLYSEGKLLETRWTSVGIFFIPTLIIYFALGSPIGLEYPELKGFNFKGGMVIRPEFLGMLFGLSIYTAAFISETVRSGIISVSKGQREASQALGLKSNFIMRLIIIPQALRVIIPPLTSQYLNLTKNSSLGIAIGYADLVHGFGGISLNQTGRAIEIMMMVMLTYLTISLTISFFMNLYNKSVQFKGNA